MTYYLFSKCICYWWKYATNFRICYKYWRDITRKFSFRFENMFEGQAFYCAWKKVLYIFIRYIYTADKIQVIKLKVLGHCIATRFSKAQMSRRMEDTIKRWNTDTYCFLMFCFFREFYQITKFIETQFQFNNCLIYSGYQFMTIERVGGRGFD